MSREYQLIEGYVVLQLSKFIIDNLIVCSDWRVEITVH